MSRSTKRKDRLKNQVGRNEKSGGPTGKSGTPKLAEEMERICPGGGEWNRKKKKGHYVMWVNVRGGFEDNPSKASNREERKATACGTI